jgi:hypothetical protein
MVPRILLSSRESITFWDQSDALSGATMSLLQPLILSPTFRILHWRVSYTVPPSSSVKDLVLGRENSRPPLLKAPARAGAEISLFWTPITRMHNGPIIAYLGYLPSPNTPPQEVKFFKIWERAFDASVGKIVESNLTYAHVYR